MIQHLKPYARLAASVVVSTLLALGIIAAPALGQSISVAATDALPKSGGTMTGTLVATNLRVTNSSVPSGVGFYSADSGNSTMSFAASGSWGGNIDASSSGWAAPNSWVIGWAASSGASLTTGFSRLSNGVAALGNGSAGNASGTLVLTKSQLNSSSGPFWSAGSGSPESAVTAPVGSLYSRTDGGAGTSFYVKESGAGNTGWVAK